MALSNAERQSSYRQRQARRAAGLEAAVADLTARLTAAEMALEAALEEQERLAAVPCRHPAGAVDGGTGRACGAEVW